VLLVAGYCRWQLAILLLHPRWCRIALKCDSMQEWQAATLQQRWK